MGFAVHLLIAAIIGSIFGVLVARQRELLLWGLAYGVLWWFLGPLTLLPILLGEPVAWDVATAQDLIPSLLGHLAYGASTAAVLACWCARRSPGCSSPRYSTSDGTGRSSVRRSAPRTR
ncbi:hypothetical protein [Streptomyces sp. BP-8]|uniref:DUF1440 domain-containing protein n=1 Tax=Streptomyces sirii TaxID=3127701 RepID=A0ABZ2QK99_9ACTN